MPVAVQAFALMASDVPDLVFVVAGDGRDRGALARLAPGVRARVVMLGNVPHEILPRYHASADVFVAPALGQESFGIVLVEAMAAGVPIVASGIPGYREVVRAGIEGLLVPPGDAGALAAAVRRVLTDEALSTSPRTPTPNASGKRSTERSLRGASASARSRSRERNAADRAYRPFVSSSRSWLGS